MVWQYGDTTRQLASHSLEHTEDSSFNFAAYCPIQPTHVNSSGLDYSPRQAKVGYLYLFTCPH